MKKLLTFLITATISVSGVAQNLNELSQTAVWATVDDTGILPTGHESNLKSQHMELQQLIDTYQITSVVQAFPSSKKEDLLKVYQFNCNCEPEVLSRELNQISTISRAEVMPELTPFYTPDDFSLVFANDYALELINAKQAWEYSMGDTAVDIAITDTNYDLTHQELLGTVSVIDTPFYQTSYYHGTAVAITAAGNTDNAVGKSSIGSNCQLQLYNMTYNRLLTATYAGARVINASWGSCSYSSYVQDIIDEVYENGSIIVAAAGNGSTCNDPTALVYPAANNHVISVSSIGPSNNHERSIGDPSTTHQHNDSVDIVAPGYDVALTVAEGWYLTGNGTSFAAPYVSGTIGLMLSINPCLTFEEVEAILYSTAYNVDTINPNYAGLLGAGRLDAGAALAATANYSTFPAEIETVFDCNSETFSLLAVAPNHPTIISSTLWNTGENTSEITTGQSGSYKVSLTDANGCPAFATTTVVVPEPLTLNVDLFHPLCAEEATGEIHIYPAGGAAPYLMSLDGNVLASNIVTNLLAGDYLVSLMDSLGCEREQLAVIEDPDKLEVLAEIGADEMHDGSGYIDTEVKGGIYPYIYQWSTGDQTEDLSHLSVGEYTLDLIDANGCLINEKFIISDESTAGLIQHESEGVSLYPNPSNGDAITISWEKEMQTIELYAESGQLLISENPFGNSIIISNLSTGVYLVKLISTSGTVGTKKLIVSH
ncbi:MAG: S8 family serine peptidase [Crocinitomicaceae bacterium]